MTPDPTSPHGSDTASRLTQLAVLRDEIRLKIHLASMDVRDEWAALEPELERALGRVGVATRDMDAAVRDLVSRVRLVRRKIR